MKHELQSARLACLVEQRSVVWELSAGSVGDRTPVSCGGMSSARNDLATQCLPVMRENRMRMPALWLQWP